MSKLSYSRAGMGFVEIVIAVLIVTACAVPIIYMVTSSRTDTTKAINYLRAVELANEVLDWAAVAEFSKLDSSSLSAFTGSLVEESSGSILPVAVPIISPENLVWKSDGLMAEKLSYSEQYGIAYFYREVAVEDVTATYLQPNMLKKVTVWVKWSEAHRPANINRPDDRNRQIELSVLILNDNTLKY